MSRIALIGISRFGYMGEAKIPLIPFTRYLYYHERPFCIEYVQNEHTQKWPETERIHYVLRHEVPEHAVWIDYARDVIAQFQPEIETENTLFLEAVFHEHDPYSKGTLRMEHMLELVFHLANPSVLHEDTWLKKAGETYLTWLKAIVMPCEEAIAVMREDLKAAVEKGHARRVSENYGYAFGHVFFACNMSDCVEFAADWTSIRHMDKYFTWKDIYSLNKNMFEKYKIYPQIQERTQKTKS